MPDFDSSLLSVENLDRSSPELWPEPIPGVSGFSHYHSADPFKSLLDEKLTSKEDLDLLRYLSHLNRYEFVIELKKLYDLCYQLGLDESKEMTRGKYLNILETSK
uniref:Protein lin-52 homolog n=1 Tax=Cacopsylla melanoneura TaxID=428564 RepID=A0A8D8QU21_9HEMI